MQKNIANINMEITQYSLSSIAFLIAHPPMLNV